MTALRPSSAWKANVLKTGLPSYADQTKKKGVSYHSVPLAEVPFIGLRTLSDTSDASASATASCIRGKLLQLGDEYLASGPRWLRCIPIHLVTTHWQKRHKEATILIRNVPTSGGIHSHC